MHSLTRPAHDFSEPVLSRSFVFDFALFMLVALAVVIPMVILTAH